MEVLKKSKCAVFVAVLTYVLYLSYKGIPELSINITDGIHVLQTHVQKNNSTKRSQKITKLNYINRKLHFKTKKLHKILWWNEPSWLEKNQSVYNKMSQCEYSNCEVVYNKQLVDESSAIIMSVVYMEQLRRAPVMGKHRKPEQAWIFFTYESPVHMSSLHSLDDPQWTGVFNWSWTYRQDADIFAPYGSLIEKSSITQRNYSNLFTKKSKMAAWLVSNCKASSKRDVYSKLLREFIDIDIYGKCGKPAPIDILDRINDEYYFYLGFENSFCKDYVTEKFFKYYNLDVINVVRGSFNYNKHLPNGSFTNTADFTSVKALAEFMRELSTNEKAYTEYIKNKDKYQANDRQQWQNSMCKICEMINNMGSYRKVYGNVREWLGQCRTPTDLY